jgi:glycosidase
VGVWQRASRPCHCREHPDIMNDSGTFDLKETDISGSPYCIRDYIVDTQIGGKEGLATARKEFANRGIRLVLDFVPNHVAPDHPWTLSKPEYFIRGSEEELAKYPHDYYRSKENIYAKARDPFYPPWPDILQLNAFDGNLRKAILETLKKIAAQCDGIRCDMAMLVMNDIFAKTWSNKAEQKPVQDFWSFVIPQVKKQFPGFIFMAESYWDTEPVLLLQGFDFCYDKRYYDVVQESAAKSMRRLMDCMEINDKLLRFLENHDEKRAAGLFTIGRHKALALASLAQQGACLLHDGQLEGRTVRVPVFLSRRQNETENKDLKDFYRKLLKILQSDAIRSGKWSLCKVSGWFDNQSCLNLLVWEWLGEHENLLFVVNLSDQPAQALVKSSYAYQPGRTYQLFDVISGELFIRDSDEMNDPGLFVGLQAWGAHAFHIEF